MNTARRLSVVAVTILGALVFQIGPAEAAISYKPAFTFGEFTGPTDVTVDQSNGNVYITDSGANEIDVFGKEGGSPTGGIVSPLTGGTEHIFDFGGEPSAAAIDESGGLSSRDLYVSDARHNVVDKFKLNTAHEYEYLCQFTGFGKGCEKDPKEASTWEEPDGVAVDSHGNVYVASFGPEHGGVYEFNAQGEDVKAYRGGDIGLGEGPVGVVVDSVGDIYVNNYRHSVVKINSEGNESILDNNDVRAVAVDGHGNVFVEESSNVFADEDPRIAEYSQAGVKINSFGEGIPSEGLAVNAATEEVYVANRGTEPGTVNVFRPVVVPDVTTDETEDIGKTTVTVTGAAEPVGVEEVKYFFQYGTTSGYGQETPEESTTTSKVVNAHLAGLEPGTEYHYRLVAKNVNGSNFGEDRTFTTLPAVTSGPCSPIDLRGTSGTLCLLISPEGSETSYAFMYGVQAPECSSAIECYFAYEHNTELSSAGGGDFEEQFTTTISELQPATNYHYRVLLRNELGFTLGKVETFTTPPAEPVVNGQAQFATGGAAHEATLHGMVNPGQGITTYHFIYGPTTTYEYSTPDAYTQLNYEEDPVEQPITGLQPDVVYHYALVATNASGTTVGKDETFTTLMSPPPAEELTGGGGPSLEVTSTPGIVQPPPPALLPVPVFPPERTIMSPPKCKKGFVIVRKGGKCVKAKGGGKVKAKKKKVRKK